MPSRALCGFSHTVRGWATLLLVLAWCGSVSAQSDSGDPNASSSAPVSESFSRRLSLSHFERGIELERRAEIAQALHEYTESIALDSTLGEAYLKLGGLREAMGDAREAELVYSQAVRLSDTRARALLLRAHLYRAAGRSEQAQKDLEASVELEPNREALEELARHYVEVHAWSAALATFRRIVESARQSGDSTGLQSAQLELRALRVLAAETDPCAEQVPKHDWVGRALSHIAQR